VSDLRDFLRGERRREQIELAHLALREILPGTVVGRALPAAPTGRNRGRGRAVSVIRPSPNGRHVYLEAHDVTLDGSPIVWDTLVRSQGVDIDLPTSRIPCRADGYYDLALPSVEFDPADLGWVGEATVNIRVDEEPREPFPSGPAYANGGGMKLEPQMLGRIVPGQDTQVSIDAPGAPVAKKIRASMQLVDRQVAEVLDDDPGLDLAGYRVRINTSVNVFGVERREDGSTAIDGELLQQVSMPLSDQTYYWLRARIDGQRIRGRVWSGARGDEPSGWDLDVTDPEPTQQSEGLAGIANASGVELNERWVDLIEVRHDGGSWHTTDFSGYPTSDDLIDHDWATVVRAGIRTHRVVEVGSATGGKVAEWGPSGSYQGVDWLAWETPGSGADTEVLARVRGDGESVGVLLRGQPQ
jgi:hypothetical protein